MYNKKVKKSEKFLILFLIFLFAFLSILQIFNFSDNILKIIVLIGTIIPATIFTMCYFIAKKSYEKDEKSKATLILIPSLLLTLCSIFQIIRLIVDYRENIFQIIGIIGSVLAASILSICYLIVKNSNKK